MAFPKAFYEWLPIWFHIDRCYQFLIEVVDGLEVADRDAATHMRVDDSVLPPRQSTHIVPYRKKRHIGGLAGVSIRLVGR